MAAAKWRCLWTKRNVITGCEDLNQHKKEKSKMTKRVMKMNMTSRLNANRATNHEVPRARRLISFAILLCGAVFAVSAAIAQTNRPAATHRADRILVKPRPGVDLNAMHAS